MNIKIHLLFELLNMELRRKIKKIKTEDLELSFYSSNISSIKN